MSTPMLTRGHGDTETRSNTNSPRRRVAASPRLLLTALLAFFGAANMAVAGNSNAGTKAGAFLKIATDARGVALNSTMVSAARGSEGTRWNPAALALTDSEEVAATHIEYYQDVSIENVSFAHPLAEGAIGGSVFYLNSGDMEGRDDTGAQTGDFSASDVVASAGYGRRIQSRDEIGMDIYLGGQFKIVQEKISDAKYTNPAIDLGVLVDPKDYLRIGATVRNLATGRADFPKELTGGVSYNILPVVTTSLAVRYTDDAPLRFGLSGEYRMPQLENSVIRAGYQTHDDLDSSIDAKISGLRSASLAGLTFGGGMDIRPPQFKTLNFALDYTMAPFGALGISHTLTVKMRW